MVQKFKIEFRPKYLHSWLHIRLSKRSRICHFWTDTDCQNQWKMSIATLHDKLERVKREVHDIRDRVRKKPNKIKQIESNMCQSNLPIVFDKDRWNQESAYQMDETIFSIQFSQTNSFIIAKIVELSTVWQDDGYFNLSFQVLDSDCRFRSDFVYDFSDRRTKRIPMVPPYSQTLRPILPKLSVFSTD